MLWTYYTIEKSQITDLKIEQLTVADAFPLKNGL
jgi:hypothetical protein